MLNFWNVVLPYIQGLGAAGGIAFAIWLLKIGGNKWIEHQFKKEFADYEHKKNIELTNFKHDQNKEIEKIKSSLDRLKYRGVSANDKEFSAIDDLWSKYANTHQSVNRSMISFIQFPDLNNIGDESAKDFLQASELNTDQIESVINSADKNKAYSRQIKINSLNTSARNIYELHEMLLRYVVYIPNDLENEFRAALDFLSKANAHDMTNFQMPEARLGDYLSKFLAEEKAVIGRLQEKVRSRIVKE